MGTNAENSIKCGCQNSTAKLSDTGKKVKPAEENPLDATERTITNTVDIQSIAFGSVDKRVALTVSPKTYKRDESLYAKRVAQILGEVTHNAIGLKKGVNFYGLLRNALGSSSGLIFPYTPNIQMSHTTNYNTLEIIHSNINYNYYKNTTPPTITLTATFSADNRDNALHMLSAIWFLTACSKCEFGENSKNPGLPPPVLYLNGYDHLIDNIPVVIKSFNYTYPETKHYVNLLLDFTKNYNNGEDFCQIYKNSSATSSHVEDLKDKISYTDENGMETTYLTKNYEGVIPQGATFEQVWTTREDSMKTSYSEHNISYSFWLPTDLQVTIQLAVQPNLLKTRKQWTLPKYKSGILITDSGKNPLVSMVGTLSNKELQSITAMTLSTPDNPGSDTDSKSCDCTCGTQAVEFIPSGWTW